jgi:transcription-repair coupling factor (superfamily II helicase)
MKSIGPVIDKTEAFIISEIFNKNDSSLVYIGKDDREIISIKKKLSWLHPNLRVLLYKAWDQIPYDNISPSKEIQTSRLETLFYLSSKKEKKIIILTTLNGIIQKTLPKNEITKNFITISKKINLK